MTRNKLKLINDKTDAPLPGSRRSVSVLQDNHLSVGNHSSFKVNAKYVEVYTDAAQSMVNTTDHISRSACLEIRTSHVYSHVCSVHVSTSVCVCATCVVYV